MNYNDIPLYNLLPGLLENESDPSRSTAFMLEDILKRLQKLENGESEAEAVWGKITGTLSDQSDLQAKLNSKANKTDLDTKADKTALEAKADKTYVDAMLETKANRSELADLVSDSELTTALANKADKSEIPDVTGLAKNFSVDGTTITMNEDRVLSAVADENAVTKEYVDTELDKKSNKTDVDASLALKANKADIPDFSTLASKTDLAGKEDSFEVDGTSIGMTEGRVLYAITEGTSVSKEYVDNQNTLNVKYTDFNVENQVALPTLNLSTTEASVVGRLTIDLESIIKKLLPNLGRTKVQVSASTFQGASIKAGSKTYNVATDLVHIEYTMSGLDTIDAIDIDIYKEADSISPVFKMAHVIINVKRFNGEYVEYRTTASQLSSTPMAFTTFTENQAHNSIVVTGPEWPWTDHWAPALGDVFIDGSMPDYWPFTGAGIAKTIYKDANSRTLLAMQGNRMWRATWSYNTSSGNNYRDARKNVTWVEITNEP